MQDHTSTAHLGLPWPDAYLDLLPIIKNEWCLNGNIYLSRQLGGGKSGAAVFAADIESAEFTGQAILKLDHATDSAHQEAHEASLHGQAIADAPKFAASHLPRLLNALHHERQFALLSTIAGRGLEYAETWPDCAFEQQLQAVRAMSHGLLEEWNADYRLGDGMHMPPQLLKGWLDYRTIPAEGGRIHGFLSEKCGLSPEAPSITFEGQWYPNPLAFAVGGRELPDRLRLRAVTGHSHGDLHGLNLLVSPSRSEQPNYHLIDLADYQSSQFLLFDHAYFELAYLLTSRANATSMDWETILTRLSRFDQIGDQRGLRADDLGLIEIVGALRKEVTDWIERHQADRLSYMESQYLLARVAAGLNFTNKLVSDETRRMAFVYAASNLKDYLKLNRLDWPKYGLDFSLGDKAVTAGDGGVAVARPSIVEDAEEADRPLIAKRSGDGAVSSDAGDRTAQTRGDSFVGELLRRSVITVAGLYGIASWLLVQVIQSLSGSADLPSWTGGVVATALILGLPAVCFAAWSAAGARGRSLRDVLVAACIIAILAIVVTRQVRNDISTATSTATTQTEQQSIAVLPFRNLSVDSADDTFTDGLTIEIMGTLARSGMFRVPGQSSSFIYKNQSEDLRAIGETLGVEYILEGSVRRNENMVRIEAQLVQADDGFLVWSDVFVDTMDDIFFLQQQIANAIGNALKTPLGIEASTLETERTSNPQAYDLFVQGLALLQQRGPGVADAAELLKQSVTLDPDFAAGWAALSLVYEVLPSYVGTVDGDPVLPATYYRLAREAATKAEGLNPDLSIVRQALATTYRRNRQWALAEDAYRDALEADPGNAAVMEDYVELLAIVGHHREGIAMAERMLQLDPLYLYRGAHIRWFADQSVSAADEMIDLFRRYPNFHAQTARVIIGYLFKTNQIERLERLIQDCDTCTADLRDRILSMIRDARDEQPETVFETYKEDGLLSYMFLEAIGGPALALQYFSYHTNSTDRPSVISSMPWGVIESIGQMEEFKFLVEQLGIVDYWRERGWPERCRPLEGLDFECT